MTDSQESSRKRRRDSEAADIENNENQLALRENLKNLKGVLNLVGSSWGLGQDVASPRGGTDVVSQRASGKLGHIVLDVIERLHKSVSDNSGHVGEGALPCLDCTCFWCAC